jgi:hypothetical protein
LVANSPDPKAYWMLPATYERAWDSVSRGAHGIRYTAPNEGSCNGRLWRIVLKNSGVGTIKVLHKSALHASHRHRMAKSSCRMGIDRDLRDLAGRELVGALYFERGGPGLDLKPIGQRR